MGGEAQARHQVAYLIKEPILVGMLSNTTRCCWTEGQATGLVYKDDGWRLPVELWAKMEPLLPARKRHPLGCHRPRIPDRVAMNAILLVLRTGMQWNALKGSGICSSSSAHRRFSEWRDAGVFEEFWRKGLLEYDRLKGIDWSWLSVLPDCSIYICLNRCV